MLLSETLGIASVEGFLGPAAARRIVALMAEHLAGAPERTTSVHSVAGLPLAAVVAAYEPEGRTEVGSLPSAAVELLDEAGRLALPALRRTFPSAAAIGEWIYLEYRQGQHITAHADYAVDEEAAGRPHVAGIGVPLEDGYTGGEFFVETTASGAMWREDDPERIAQGADFTSEWFPALPRTRWTCRPAAGTAVCYGSQLAHGTLPVRSGVARKVIGFLSA